MSRTSYRRALAGAGLTVVALVGVVAPAPMASAAAHGYASKLNLWENESYGGHLESRTSYDSDFHNDKYKTRLQQLHSFNDAASSLSNRSSYWWKLFKDTKYHSTVVCIRPNSHVADLRPYHVDDWISSVKRISKAKPSGCGATIGTAN
jgi:Peptidase inhibitor family I36